MAGFISDEEMEKLSPSKPAGFLSDDEMAALESKAAPEEESTLRQLARGTLDTVLPAGGAVVAGLAATPETLGAATIPAAALGYAGGKQLSRIAKHYLLGDPWEEESAAGLVKQTAGDLAEGATAEMGGQVAGKVLSSAVSAAAPAMKKAGQTLQSAAKHTRSFAEDAALNATGATGVQASKFADDAGEQLLDRGLVKFGDAPKNIAGRAQAQVDQANAQIDAALSRLEADGVSVDRNTIYNRVREKINQLRGDESQADIALLLEKELDNIVAAADVSGSQIPISKAEHIKRGYNRKAGNWMDQEKGQAGKELYQTYRHEVENAAEAANPEVARLFKEGKETYGLLAPIQEAAERRAMTTNQSPVGGFLDVTSAAADVASGGPGLLGPIARRIASPRISSSAAVTANAASKKMNAFAETLMRSPRMSQLAQENPKAFTALVTRLQERAPMQTQIPAAASGNELDQDSSVPSQYQEQPSPAPSPSPTPGPAKAPGKEEMLKRTHGSKYAQVLQNAAQKGEQSMAAAHFVLSQRDPEYRKLFGENGP